MVNSVFFLKGRFELPGEMDQGYGAYGWLDGPEEGRNWSTGCHRSPKGVSADQREANALAAAPEGRQHGLALSSPRTSPASWLSGRTGGSALWPRRNPGWAHAPVILEGRGWRGGNTGRGLWSPRSPWLTHSSLTACPAPLHLFWLFQLRSDPEKALGKRGAVGGGSMWKGLFYFVHSVFVSILPRLVFGEGKKCFIRAC